MLSVHDGRHGEGHPLACKARYFGIDIGALLDQEPPRHHILQQADTETRSCITLDVLVDDGGDEGLLGIRLYGIEHGVGGGCPADGKFGGLLFPADRKSTRLNSSHVKSSYAVL